MTMFFTGAWLVPAPYDKAMDLARQQGVSDGTLHVYTSAMRCFLIWAWKRTGDRIDGVRESESFMHLKIVKEVYF